MSRAEIEKVSAISADIVDERIERLKDLLPEVFTEGRIDVEKLRAVLGNLVDDRAERYSFTWAGKTDALRALQTPSHATLKPVRDESVNFDTTQHLFIEGDNLEVLKLLYKSYFGRVKMIYIDPPYNTHRDRVYADDYARPLESYLQQTGQKDQNGNLTTSSPETTGRKHSDWLSMMYPRLFLARQLLQEDGVIMISIDDHEIHHLRLLMNELFGSENFVATLVWEKGRKNDAKLFSVGHEYVVIYARSLEKLRELGTVWREPKPGAQQIWDEYCRLRAVHGNNDRAIECELQNWFRHLPKQHPSKALSRYRRVDKHGPWRDRDISWPGGGGPQYDVIHPIKKLPCDVPEGGWRFATPEAMQEQIRLGLVEFREDHTEPPFRKAHLRPVPEELDDDTTLDAEEEDDPSAVGMQVMGSYIYKQSQTAVKDLRKLMGAKVFDNPKDHEVLARLIRYCGSSSNDGIILDFFAGSCSTAEAVLRLNHEDRGTRRFIMVQLPEPTPESSDARKAGYANIADIGKERIRRVVKTLKREDEGQRPLPTCETSEDLGFRVFALAPSHWQPWEAPPADTSPESYVRALSLFHDPLAGDWRLEDVIYEVILREGYSLTSRIEVVEGLPEATVWRVIDEDKEQSFSICLDDRLTLETTKALELGKDDLFICRDIALSDTEAANLALQCRLKTI